MLRSLAPGLASRRRRDCVHTQNDGVYSLPKGQQTEAIEMKNFSPTFRALDDYDADKLYVEAESLQRRGITPADPLLPVALPGSATGSAQSWL